MTVDVIVVGSRVARVVRPADIRIVWWNIPGQRRHVDRGVEPQILRCVVHPSCTIEPDAVEVDGHIDFVASVGVVSIDPYLVIGGVDALHPHLVQQYIRFYFVIVAAVNHYLLLCVQVGDCTLSLRPSEVVD